MFELDETLDLAVHLLTTKSLLTYANGRSGGPIPHAVNKATGEDYGRIDLPAQVNTAPMTDMHEGRRYIVLSVGGPDFPAEHVALALPEE